MTIEERLDRTGRRGVPGTLGGRSEQAQPVSPRRERGQVSPSTPPPFTGHRATMYVASYDASEATKATADYVCDLLADEVQIDAAIAAVDAVGGGVVQLSEGRFSHQADINMADTTRVWLRGLGFATELLNQVFIGGGAGPHYDIVASGEMARVSDLHLYGNMLLDYGSRCRLHDLYVSGWLGSDGAAAAHNHLRVERVQTESLSPGGYGIDFQGRLASPAFEKVHILGCTTGPIRLLGAADVSGSRVRYLTLGNNISGKVTLTNVEDVSVIGNVSTSDLEITNGTRGAVAGNVFNGSYVETTSTGIIRAGNSGTGF